MFLYYHVSHTELALESHMGLGYKINALFLFFNLERQPTASYNYSFPALQGSSYNIYVQTITTLCRRSCKYANLIGNRGVLSDKTFTTEIVPKGMYLMPVKQNVFRSKSWFLTIVTNYQFLLRSFVDYQFTCRLQLCSRKHLQRVSFINIPG